jgi:hypothetical protein
MPTRWDNPLPFAHSAEQNCKSGFSGHRLLAPGRALPVAFPAGISVIRKLDGLSVLVTSRPKCAGLATRLAGMLD